MLTTVIGLDDMVVVSTADAVLVPRATRPKASRRWSNSSRRRTDRAAVEHRRIYRPWGYYQDIDIAARYQVKRIVVKPGSKLSLQKHFHRAEHWVVVKGTAEVTVWRSCSRCARKRIDLYSDRRASTGSPIPERSRSN